tara:strand:- start:50 stop:796 length:747 start_codon:yes stop_codon:yes gene_type:complete
MIGFNGGLIGQDRTSTPSAAVGVWTPNEQIKARRTATWPSTGFAIVLDGLVQYLDAGKTASYPGSGATWTDLSGNGYTATLVNSPAYSAANGGVIEFNGTSHYATSTLPGLTNFTVSAWIKWLSVQGGERQLIATFNDQLGITINSSKFFVFNGGVITGAQTVAINTWYNWVVTSTSGSTKIIINKVDDATNSAYRAISAGATMIGNVSGQSRYLNAQIGAFSVYNKVLSTAEILQNYDADKVRFGLS